MRMWGFPVVGHSGTGASTFVANSATLVVELIIIVVANVDENFLFAAAVTGIRHKLSSIKEMNIANERNFFAVMNVVFFLLWVECHSLSSTMRSVRRLPKFSPTQLQLLTEWSKLNSQSIRQKSKIQWERFNDARTTRTTVRYSTVSTHYAHVVACGLECGTHVRTHSSTDLLYFIPYISPYGRLIYQYLVYSLDGNYRWPNKMKSAQIRMILV